MTIAVLISHKAKKKNQENQSLFVEKIYVAKIQRIIAYFLNFVRVLDMQANHQWS